MISIVSLRLTLEQVGVFCCDGKHEVEHGCPSLAGSHVRIRVEGPVLVEKNLLADNREIRMNGPEIAFDEHIGHLLGWSN
jgi:hypothetical protein